MNENLTTHHRIEPGVPGTTLRRRADGSSRRAGTYYLGRPAWMWVAAIAPPRSAGEAT